MVAISFIIRLPLLYKSTSTIQTQALSKHYNKNHITPTHKLITNYDINRKETTALTLVKFGTSKMDTIKGEFAFNGRSVSLRKIWFNGELKSREFNVIK